MVTDPAVAWFLADDDSRFVAKVEKVELNSKNAPGSDRLARGRSYVQRLGGYFAMSLSSFNARTLTLL